LMEELAKCYSAVCFSYCSIRYLPIALIKQLRLKQWVIPLETAR